MNVAPVKPHRPAVLFVGSGVPWRGGAGYLVRQMMHLEALAALDITLHTAMFDCAQADPMPVTLQHVVHTALPPVFNRKEGRWTSRWRDVSCRLPMMIRTMQSDAARAAIAHLHPHQFHAVFAYRCDFAYAAGVFGHPRLILDIDDPEHLRRAQSRTMNHSPQPWWQRWSADVDLARLRRFELKCAKHAAACMVCQPSDAQPFRSVGVEPLIVPNCVQVDDRPPRRVAHEPVLLFVGNMQGDEHSPNVDAMRWFVRDIWPKIRAAVPHARLVLAGPIRSCWRDEVAAVQGVEVRGFVDDLAQTYAHAAVSIAPIRIGTGTRIKVLESLAHGCPVVSTTKGCEGLDLRADADVENLADAEIAVADDPTRFADRCIMLLGNEGVRARLGQSGWKAVFDRYNRAARTPWLAQVLSGLLGVPMRSTAMRPAGASAEC